MTAIPPAPRPLQASRLLACLLPGERRGSGDPYSTPASGLVTVWRLLAALNVQQLRALSDCPQFYALPHTDTPEEPLPTAGLAAVLEVGRLGAGFICGCASSKCRPQMGPAGGSLRMPVAQAHSPF